MSDLTTLLENAPPAMRLETELLIANALGWNRAKVLAFGEVVPPAGVLRDLQADLARLHGGEPLAYITGVREFYGLEFSVSPAVLIPRPDTELLVELAASQAPQGARVVDLGTGSGAIAVSLKYTRPDLRVTATDRSIAALAVAGDNAQRHGCDIEFVESDWYQDLAGEFDLIISNPPYLAPDDPHLSALRFEPAGALVAGGRGLDDYRKIAAGALLALPPGGVLLVEQGAEQADAVAAIFAGAGLNAIVTYDDLAGHRRVTRAQRAI